MNTTTSFAQISSTDATQTADSLEMDKYAQTAGSPWLKATYVLNGLISAVGISLNVWLIVATCKNKSLQSSACNVLIALYSFCCIFGFLDVYIPMFVVFAYPSVALPSQLECSLLHVVTTPLACYLYPLMLAISLDRLLSVFAPQWLATRNQTNYLIGICAATALYPATVALFIVRTGMSNSDPTLCRMGEALGLRQSELISALHLALIWCSVGFYAVIWRKMKRQMAKSGAAQNQASTHPMFKSLAIIVATQAIGWTTGLCGLGYILLNSTLSYTQNAIAYNFVNSFVCLCGTLDVPVLYLTSTEHRKALRKELSLFGIAQPANSNVVFVVASARNSIQMHRNSVQIQA